MWFLSELSAIYPSCCSVLQGPSLETQMVDDETETTSEELPPHLREEPPEGTVLAVNINSLQSIEENVLAKKSDLCV